VFFKSLKLHQFRNFDHLEIKFSERINVLLGENGQGKTNLLEAVYVLTHGESFRFSENETLIKLGTSESALLAEIDQNGFDYKLLTQILKSKKKFTLNGKTVTAAEIRKKIGVVLFSPESLSSIKEGADYRRELIDELLITFENRNYELILQYRKALKTRNRILKNFVEGLEGQEMTFNLLESLNPSFLKLATTLTHTRMIALRSLLKDFTEAMHYISRDSSVDISVEYLISGQNALNYTLPEVHNAMLNRLQELQSAELSAGSTLVGPHKHDLIFLYGQKDSRIFCSQGQQRAIILSFKIAQIVYHRKVHGVYPILLLDDVLSELDKSKREALISFLHEIKTQTFITTTDFSLPESFNLKDIRVTEISNGKVLEKL